MNQHLLITYTWPLAPAWLSRQHGMLIQQVPERRVGSSGRGLAVSPFWAGEFSLWGGRGRPRRGSVITLSL